MAGRGVHIRMPSRPAAIAPTIYRVLAAVEPAGFSLAQRDDLAVALAEALANAVKHGNRGRARASVSVSIDVDPRKGVTVTVKDSGKGFAREAVPDPREPE